MRDEMAHLRASDDEQYRHVWEGELKQFADGAIYGKQLKSARKDTRITKIPIEPGVEVHTFWDLGRNDQSAIWFMQKVGLQYRFIDYYENRLVDLDHYIRVLKEKDYLYGTHFLPHDAEVIILGSNNLSRTDILEAGGIKPITVVPRIPVLNEGIEQTRKVFASCWFDEDRCERGIDCLANYQYVFDDKWQTHRQTPLHNWASNGADAFRQFAQGWKEQEETTYEHSDYNYNGDAGWMM
jgi:phage terminase large subunit